MRDEKVIDSVMSTVGIRESVFRAERKKGGLICLFVVCLAHIAKIYTTPGPILILKSMQQSRRGCNKMAVVTLIMEIEIGTPSNYLQGCLVISAVV